MVDVAADPPAATAAPPAPKRSASDDVDVTRLVEWARRRDPARWALAGIVVVWSLTFFFLCKLRHDRFGTFSFDLGIYDQGVWLLSRFKDPFVTVRGLNLFGHHMNLILLFIAPFYRLGGGTELLLLVQIVSQALGAVAVFLLARDRLADRWLAVAMAAVLLLNPTYQFLTWEYFHPDAVAIGPVLFAYWAARSRRWRWFAVAVVVALLCKEDVALVVAALGLLVAARSSVRIGVITATVSAAWYLAATRLLMPAALGGLSPFYDQFFGELGSNAGEVVRNTLSHPGKALTLATENDRMSYYRMMFAPYAFLPFLSLSSFVIALPILAVNALATFPYTRDYRYHYSSMIVAALTVATVEAIARVGRTASLRRFLVGLVVVTSFGASVAWGPSPVGIKFRTGYWPLSPNPRTASMSAAVKIIPKNASVSAIFSLTPHLTHRTRIYDFPEPWEHVNWGVNGEHLPNPNVVEWIAVDMTALSEADHQLLARLQEGQFETRLDQDGILVLQRVRAGP